MGKLDKGDLVVNNHAGSFGIELLERRLEFSIGEGESAGLLLNGLSDLFEWNEISTADAVECNSDESLELLVSEISG